jgi:hypothetical protein
MRPALLGHTITTEPVSQVPYVVVRKTLAVQMLASSPHIDINRTGTATPSMQVEIFYPLFFRYITRRATHSSQVGTMPATYQS